jgi:starch phosphorylase
MQSLLDSYVPGWRTAPEQSETWARIDMIPDAELWEVRCQQRKRLGDVIRARSVRERLGRGEPVSYAVSAIEGWSDADLTIGFARRIATYKRLYLITRSPERAVRLLTGSPGVQIAIAGRAHPQDDDAKRTVQGLFHINDLPYIGSRAVMLEDYDLQLAAMIVQGCDVWLNLPRRGQEASGTSGMKSVMNGGLQLSVLDGWWDEAFDGENGWGIASDASASYEDQDARDAAACFDLLELEALPLFNERDEFGVPLGWTKRMKASLRTLLPRFSARRMLLAYDERAHASLGSSSHS